MPGLQDRRRERHSPAREVDKTQQRDGTAGPGGPKDDGGDGKAKKTFMDRWVEPSLSGKASYRDHGGSPYGVLEHMQPLGELPNAKVKARVKGEGKGKGIGGKLSSGLGLDAEDTPEGTPAPTVAPQAPVQKAKATVRSRSLGYLNDGTDEYTPPPSKKRGPTPRSAGPPVKSGSKDKVYTKEKMKAVVEAAKARAIEVNKPDLASAVQEIYVQSLKDPRLNDLLVGVLKQTATPEQTAEFQEYVRAAKRKLKNAKDGTQADNRDIANGTPATPTASHPIPNATSSQVENAPVQSTEKQGLPKPKISLKLKSSPKGAKQHDTGKAKMTKSPKKRSDSINSDSSLTSMTSNGDDDVEFNELENGNSRSSMKVNGTGTRGQTPKRGRPSNAMRGVKRTSDDADPEGEREIERARDLAAKRGRFSAQAPSTERSSAEFDTQGERERSIPARRMKRASDETDVKDERDRERELDAKKQRLSEKIERDPDFPESNVRGATHQTPAPASASARRTRAQQARAMSPDPDSSLSSPSTSGHSSAQAEKVPTNPFGRKAKIKQSPEKKQLQGYNGLSSVGGARLSSPTGADDNEEASENNDFCSACGGSGFLLCCDGCDRSFHFSCLDPPLNDNASELNEPWYCYICVAKRPVAPEQLEKPPRGLFAGLFTNLRKRNPTNFALPQEIRDYFEGVSADKEGSFIEAVNTRSRNRAGYDELPDYSKLKDAKGNTVLCYFCHKSSGSTRSIIQCDYCGQNWHLDCLDPPLANPPARSMEGKKVNDWMCPLHADHELRKLDTRLLYPRRRIHIRKPRNARVVESSLKRGNVNNGLVEVIEDDSDGSDSEFYEEETPDEAIVYRLPASGIKLDFIDKIKNARVQGLYDGRVRKKARISAAIPSQLEQANFARRSFRDKQAALNLAQFAKVNTDLDFGGNKVENLVGTLIAEAPNDVVAQMLSAEQTAEENAHASSSAIPPSPPSSEQPEPLSASQRVQLQMLQELIRRRLDISKV